ncbi:unnamed protein product, partial [Ectocarpus sp. 12 AP-2014]
APAGIEPRRLQVYRDLVYRNIEGFISSAFPVLRSLYEDAAWEARVRGFIQQHKCKTPLFLQISEEYLEYLSGIADTELMPFEAELAHYEWLELAVDVADGQVPALRAGVAADKVQARLSPAARLASYRFPVHRIGPSFQPSEAGDPVFLLVYRDREARVQFMELSAGSARLIHEIDGAKEANVEDLLERLATEWQMDPIALASFGWQQLCEFNDLGVIALDPSGV